MEWPYDDCPVGCHQLTCTHKPHEQVVTEATAEFGIHALAELIRKDAVLSVPKWGWLTEATGSPFDLAFAAPRQKEDSR